MGDGLFDPHHHAAVHPNPEGARNNESGRGRFLSQLRDDSFFHVGAPVVLVKQADDTAIVVDDLVAIIPTELARVQPVHGENVALKAEFKTRLRQLPVAEEKVVNPLVAIAMGRQFRQSTVHVLDHFIEVFQHASGRPVSRSRTADRTVDKARERIRTAGQLEPLGIGRVIAEAHFVRFLHDMEMLIKRLLEKITLEEDIPHVCKQHAVVRRTVLFRKTPPSCESPEDAMVKELDGS